MAVRDIVIAPHPTLRVKCEPVVEYSRDLHTLLDDMHESMVVNNGIGLAAPQVGIPLQVAIIDISSDYIEQPAISPISGVSAAEHVHEQRLELINPKIVSTTKKVSSEEGCLSIPDYRETISRFYSISVEACDRHGRKFSFSANELLAFAVQHEVDHLHGVLFVDHLSRLKKTLFRKWAIKNLGTADL
jgi:peptide deformylase